MSSRAIFDAIGILSGTKNLDSSFILQATVQSVDVAKRTCNVKTVTGSSEIQIADVLLMTGVEDGFLLVPAVDSNVIICFSKYHEPYVALFSKIDRLYSVVGNSTMDITTDVTKFNDGSFGGMVKVEALVQKINNIENLLNELITKFNAHTHILTLSAGTGTAAPTVTSESGTIEPVTSKSDLENTKVTHGE